MYIYTSFAYNFFGKQGSLELIYGLQVKILVPELTKKKKKSPLEFLLWHNGISGISAALGHRFYPQPRRVG